MHILLVDDDVSEYELLSATIGMVRANATLTYIQDSLELITSLELLDKKDLPEVILLDINMPFKNGFECLESLKNNNRLNHLPVMMYSTSFLDDTIKKAYNLGADKYVCKPDGISKMKQFISKLCSKEIIDYSNKSFTTFKFSYC